MKKRATISSIAFDIGLGLMALGVIGKWIFPDLWIFASDHMKGQMGIVSLLGITIMMTGALMQDQISFKPLRLSTSLFKLAAFAIVVESAISISLPGIPFFTRSAQKMAPSTFFAFVMIMAGLVTSKIENPHKKQSK